MQPENATLVAELWGINSQPRHVSALIRELEGELVTRPRVAWLTFDEIHNRLTSETSIRRQMGHISDFVKFARERVNSAGRPLGKFASVDIRYFLEHIKPRGGVFPVECACSDFGLFRYARN